MQPTMTMRIMTSFVRAIVAAWFFYREIGVRLTDWFGRVVRGVGGFT
jgi:hypothetical protein